MMRRLFYLCLFLAPAVCCAAAQNSCPSLCITGIMDASAVVNNKIVRPGEDVGGAIVLEIKDEAVKFLCQGEVFTKTMGEGCSPVEEVTPRVEAVPEEKSKFEVFLVSLKGLLKQGPQKQEDKSKGPDVSSLPRSERNYQEAKENFLNAIKLDKAKVTFAPGTDRYNEKRVQAYIYYKKALKYAQWAFPLVSREKRDELRRIINECRDKEARVSDAQSQIDSFCLPQLVTPQEISVWLKKNILYKLDLKIHDEEDYWQSPKETVILGTGDCEDSAFLAQSLLENIHINADVISIQYTRNGEGGGHALCVFPADNPHSYFSNCVLRSRRQGTKAIVEDYMRRELRGAAWNEVYRISLASQSRQILFKNNNPARR